MSDNTDHHHHGGRTMGAIAIALGIAAILGEYAPATYLGLPGTEGKIARIHPTTIHTSS